MCKHIDNQKVSVYISTYNRLSKLKRAIRSVLSQDYSNWELLICDDASTDGTFEFISELAKNDKRIKYFRNKENKGACETRNLGIFNATGKFITGLDDDDEFTKDRISFFLNKWNDKYSFLCCDFINKYTDNREELYYNQNKEEVVFSFKDILFENEASNQIFTLTERLKGIYGFDSRVARLQDWDTWLRLSNRYGDFIRYKHASYIMRHDHLIQEHRVSQNQKICESLHALMERNSDLYSSEERRFMRFIIDSMNKNQLFKESLYWTYKKNNIKYIIKYFIKR